MLTYFLFRIPSHFLHTDQIQTGNLGVDQVQTRNTGTDQIKAGDVGCELAISVFGSGRERKCAFHVTVFFRYYFRLTQAKVLPGKGVAQDTKQG